MRNITQIYRKGERRERVRTKEVERRRGRGRGRGKGENGKVGGGGGVRWLGDSQSPPSLSPKFKRVAVL